MGYPNGGKKEEDLGFVSVDTGSFTPGECTTERGSRRRIRSLCLGLFLLFSLLESRRSRKKKKSCYTFIGFSIFIFEL